MPKKQTWVSPNPDGGWDVKHENAKRVSAHFGTQKEAEKRAREISSNQQTELIIQGQDGKIRQKDSHGNDPCPPRDKR